MIKNVAISIIIPALNEEGYLPRLLDDLKKQTFKDFEVIVADGGSTDGTVKIAEEFGAKVTPGGSPGKARNEGAKVARGQVLLFVDADVSLSSEFLRTCLEEFHRKNLDVASCFMVPDDKRLLSRISHGTSNLFYLMTERISPAAPGFCIFVKSSLHKEIGGFDESIAVLEDHEYIKRAAKLGKFSFIRGVKIRVSTRRMKRDGWFTTLLRTGFLVAYSSIFGYPKKKIVGYKSGDYE